MKLLLDTHVVLWWLEDPSKIREEAADEIAGAEEVLHDLGLQKTTSQDRV